jgi:sugar phosphate isomerase/epimerase
MYKGLSITVFFLAMVCADVLHAQIPDRLGVVSYTFRDRFSKDVPGTLDFIKGMGIRNIEFSSLFGQTAADMRAMLDQRGMICTSFGVGFNDLNTKIEEVASNAKTLGAKYVRVASIPYQGKFTLDDAKNTVEVFNRAGKYLKEQGIMFCYHNHGFEFQPHGNGTLFDYLVQNTNPEYVSFELDTYWTMHPGQDPVALVKKYPDRFRLVHLKDLRKGVVGDLSGRSPRENDVVLGTGQVDIPGLLKASRKSNIEYFYIEDETAEVDQRVPQSIKYLMKYRKYFK